MRKAIRRWVRNWMAMTIRAERSMERLRQADPIAWAWMRAEFDLRWRMLGL